MKKGIKAKFFDLYTKVIFKGDKTYRDSDAIEDAMQSELMSKTQPDEVVIVGKIIEKRKIVKL